MSTRSTLSIIAVSLLPVLVGCAAPSGPLPAASVHEHPAVRIVVRSAYPEPMRNACAIDVVEALGRRKLLDGPPLDVEVWLAQDHVAQPQIDNRVLNLWFDNNVVPAVTDVPAASADITATVKPAASAKVVRAAGSDRAAPCAVAGDRVAAALVATLSGH